MNEVAVEPSTLKKFWLLPIALQPRTWRCSAHCTELRRGTDALCADVPDAWNCPPIVTRLRADVTTTAASAYHGK